MDSLDLYGSKVYTYNFEGRKNINSLIGVITSVGVYLFILNFFVNQCIVMFKGLNPTVSSEVQLDVHTKPGTNIDLDKDGFFFAAGVRNYLNNEYKDPMSTTRGSKKDLKENYNERTEKYEVRKEN